MPPNTQQSLLTIALLAAFADGKKDDREREEIRRIAESLTEAGTPTPLAEVYQQVLLQRTDLAQVVAGLSEASHRQLAYELAVCVCDADEKSNAAERQFLAELKRELQLDDAVTATVESHVENIAAAPLTVSSAALSPAMAASSSLGAKAAHPPEAELDASILHHAIVNGALELLPQSLASLAIIGLQVKLVHRIGQAYGYELDRGHVKEFIATAGVGMTSQYVEQIGRKIMGGLLGGIAGALGRGVGRAATGAAFSFATTYALGQLAKRYYAGGRQMHPALVRETYESMLAQAKQLQGQYSGEIQQKARSLDLTQVIGMAKGTN